MAGRGTLTLRREDGRIICEHVKLADTIGRRTVGLLGRRSLPPGQGITLRPSFSIHTFFMRFPIDVIFLDGDLVVLKIAERLPAWRTSSCRGAREVIEVSAGECARRGLSVGDRVAWASETTMPAPTATTLTEESGAAAAEPRGRVLLASSDARFVKLARFVLEGGGLEVPAAVSAENLVEALERDARVDAVLLDAEDAVATALTTSNAARALRPDVPVVLVAESAAATRSPVGVRVYDKWADSGDILRAVERAIEENEGPTEASFDGV